MNKKLITTIAVAAFFIAAYFGGKVYATNVAEKKVNEAIAKAGNFVDVDYKKVSVDLPSMAIRISDVFVSPANTKTKIKINEITINDIDDKEVIPTFLSVSFKGIEVNLDILGDDAKKIKELGYSNNLMCNFDFDYKYEKDKQDLNIQKFAIGANDAGELNVNFHLGNVNLDPEKIAGLILTYPQIMFYGVKLNYEDKSLADRVMTAIAKEQNKELNAFKKFLIQDAENEIQKEKDEFAKNVLIEIKQFIGNPKRFSISASPEKPQPLGRIMRVNDPKEAINLLNIQIKS